MLEDIGIKRGRKITISTIPPNAVPFQTLPVTSWKGLVDISCPAPATPMITDVPHPL